MAIVLESAALSGGYTGVVTMPSGIVAGDLLLAIVRYGNDPVTTLTGFTEINNAGNSYAWDVVQYRVATGSEGASIAIDPSWAHEIAVVARLSGVDTADPINVAGLPERTGGASATSKTVVIDSISPDAAGTSLAILVMAGVGNTATGLTVDGVACDFSDLALSETFTGGISVESLGASGATGTRTAVVTTAANSSQSIVGAMVALNPFSEGGGGDPVVTRAPHGLLLPV